MNDAMNVSLEGIVRGCGMFKVISESAGGMPPAVLLGR